ncbi:MAG: hypothetical protein ACK5N0_00885 [Synechococcaceae cyanobacterium]
MSDYGIQQAPDTETFIKNIAKVLTDAKGGRFLDASTYYTTNPTVQGTALEKSLSSPPYAFKRDRSASLDLNTLRNYEVVFVGGEQVDNQMLIDYIKLGGSVCLIAGTGHGGSASSEAAGWNQLLDAFGLRLESSYNEITGVRSVTSPTHPLFTGVNSLFQYWGQTIELLPDSKASVIMTSDSLGLIGYVEVPLQPEGKVMPVFYENDNYTGAFQSLDVGRYDHNLLSFGHDRISSVKVPPGYKVTLYRDFNFQGPTKVLYSDTATLLDFDNHTSSIVIEALPVFYENDNYSGAFQPLDVGSYDHNVLSFGHDRISSVKVPPGYKVTLYRDFNFQGPTKVLYSDTATLLDFDNHTSSIIIEA